MSMWDLSAEPFVRATSKTYTWNLNQDPEKPGINMGLKNMPDSRELYFMKTVRNVI